MSRDITKVWMILQTSGKDASNGGTSDNGTNDTLTLKIGDVSLTTAKTVYTESPSLGINQSLDTAGVAVQFHWTSTAGFWNDGDLTTRNADSFTLSTDGHDAYVPRTVWVITMDTDNVFDVKVHDLHWDQNSNIKDVCFSTASSECAAPSYDLLKPPAGVGASY